LVTAPLVRPIEDAQRFDLTGRSVWLLASDADGLGDIVISVAKIRPGSMNAHAHSPGGEFMYVTAGEGRFWIEGIPLPLSEGAAVCAAPGLLHNAENTGTEELVVVGVMAPGMAPGSYPESPPLFEPTGRISSVEQFSCSRNATDYGSGVVITALDPHSDVQATVTNLIDLPAGSSVRRDMSIPCFWTVLSGEGSVTFLARGSQPIRSMTTVLGPAGSSGVFASRDYALRLLEVALVR
jgi:mannose-6-phosphate isomerase-like protein (cupin superfamily)